MIDVIVVLILFIICSSIKTMYLYVEIGMGFKLLLLHLISSIGFNTIAVLLTLKSRSRIWFVSWYLLNALLLFINTNYYEFYGKFIHLNTAYVLIPEVLSLVEHLDIPLGFSDLLFIIDLPLFLYFLSTNKIKEISPSKLNAIIKSAAGITLLAIVILCYIPVYTYSDTSDPPEDYDVVSRFGTFGHCLIDLVMPPTVNRTRDIIYGNKEVSSGYIGKRPNIILIQTESLDANIINYQYHGEYVTPFLHNLTTKSLYFPFTLCYRKLGGTSDCEIAVNNSIEPPVDYSLMMYDNYDYPNSVVKVLKKNNYKVEAFHGNTRSLSGLRL